LSWMSISHLSCLCHHHLLHRHPLSINFNKRSEATKTTRNRNTAAFSNKHKSLENFFRSEY
jgi:hypothetical protein